MLLKPVVERYNALNAIDKYMFRSTIRDLISGIHTSLKLQEYSLWLCTRNSHSLLTLQGLYQQQSWINCTCMRSSSLSSKESGLLRAISHSIRMFYARRSTEVILTGIIKKSISVLMGYLMIQKELSLKLSIIR